MPNILKYALYSGALLILPLTGLAFANGNGVDEQSTKLASKSVWKNDKGEVVISTGPNNQITSTHITKSDNTFFCNSNTFEILVESRLDEADKDTFKTFDISAKLNGDKIDILSGKGLPSKIDDFFHIGVDMVCADDQISVFLTGYNDSTTESGTTLVDIIVDTVSGVVK